MNTYPRSEFGYDARQPAVTGMSDLLRHDRLVALQGGLLLARSVEKAADTVNEAPTEVASASRRLSYEAVDKIGGLAAGFGFGTEGVVQELLGARQAPVVPRNVYALAA